MPLEIPITEMHYSYSNVVQNRHMAVFPLIKSFHMAMFIFVQFTVKLFQIKLIREQKPWYEI